MPLALCSHLQGDLQIFANRALIYQLRMRILCSLHAYVQYADRWSLTEHFTILRPQYSDWRVLYSSEMSIGGF